MRRALLAAIPLVLLAQGCAATAGEEDGQTGGGAAGAREELNEQRYEVSALVLQDTKHGPELCLGAVSSSLPPQCGGIPIPNWNWAEVNGEETRSGTTWGNFHVVGTYDGGKFTVREVNPPRPPTTATTDPPYQTTCPEPAGGWQRQVDDPNGTKLEALSRAARSAPDFAGFWITYLTPMGGNVAEDPGDFVVNAAFTSNLERHEAALRRLWPGPLCVTRHARSYRDLQRVQQELTGTVGTSLGLQVLQASVREVENVVDVQAVVVDERAQKAVEERYGAGIVRLASALQPVEAAAR
jgi:hypothetical protein